MTDELSANAYVDNSSNYNGISAYLPSDLSGAKASEIDSVRKILQA